jgi:hypothetical protein
MINCESCKTENVKGSMMINCLGCEYAYCDGTCFDRHECYFHEPEEKECEGCGEWVASKEIVEQWCKECNAAELENQHHKWGEPNHV